MSGSIYLIATAHDVYRGREFETGDTVIDPWRMVADKRGVTVKRIGRNRPALISILVPSRGRPDWLHRTVYTAFKTATHTRHIEFVVYLDKDDPKLSDYMMHIPLAVHANQMRQVRLHVGERILLSECWNECYRLADGEILMHCGDDITFDTPGWDQMVRHEFDLSEDKILFVHGDDLGPHGQEFGTHGFLHRRWVEQVGYFVPPLFSSDWNDVWLNEVANQIDRRRLLPFVTEHHHYTFGKSDRDQTHREREERGEQDDVADLYKRTEDERMSDAIKLRAVMV